LTDNNPLTYVLTSAKLDATGQRWASALGEYNFDITYRAGLKNADADAMSRYPHEKLKEDEEKLRIDNNTIKAICSCLTSSYIETLPISSINIVEAIEDNGQVLAQKELREISTKVRSNNRKMAKSSY
jgi:ribonucleotide reductase alpha subunit